MAIKRFLYRPTQKLVFEDGKCLLLEAAPENIKLDSLGNGLYTTLPVLSALALLYMPIGVVTTTVSVLAFGTSLNNYLSWNQISKRLIKRVYLLNDGKTIEIENFYMINNVVKWKIEDLYDRKVTSDTVLMWKELENFLLIKTLDDCFSFDDDSLNYYPDVLKAVHNRENIDLSESEI